MVEDAEGHKLEDRRKKELADLRNNAEGLVYTTEKRLEEYASVLKPEDLLEIRSDLDALKAILPVEQEPARIKEALVRLEGSAYRIADAIYASNGSDG
jgi:molecular chaperone DnaK